MSDFHAALERIANDAPLGEVERLDFCEWLLRKQLLASRRMSRLNGSRELIQEGLTKPRAKKETTAFIPSRLKLRLRLDTHCLIRRKTWKKRKWWTPHLWIWVAFEHTATAVTVLSTHRFQRRI